MMPNAMLASTIRTLHNDRVSSELRRYARDEWHAPGHWVRALPHPVSLRQRLRRWLHRGSTPTEAGEIAAPAKEGPTQAVAAKLEAGPPCPHPAREALGLGGAAVFLRCCICGGVLIVSGNRAWTLGRDQPLATEESPCA